MSLFKRRVEPIDPRTTVQEVLMNVSDIRFFLDGHNIFQDFKGKVENLRFMPDGTLEVHVKSHWEEDGWKKC